MAGRAGPVDVPAGFFVLDGLLVVARGLASVPRPAREDVAGLVLPGGVRLVVAGGGQGPGSAGGRAGRVEPCGGVQPKAEVTPGNRLVATRVRVWLPDPGDQAGPAAGASMWRVAAAMAAGRRIRGYTVSGIALLSHDARPVLISVSCWGHNSATRVCAPCEICQAEAPRFVHGVCQVVMDITSEHAIFRPAAHMPVNSWHRAQKPSRVATGSWVPNPQSGHDQPPVPGCRTGRRPARRGGLARAGSRTRARVLSGPWLALLRAATAPEIRAAIFVIADLPFDSPGSLAKLCRLARARPSIWNVHRKSHRNCRARHPSASGYSPPRLVPQP